LQNKKLPSLRYLREFRTKENDIKVGDKVDVTRFEAGSRVDVVGISKGKGFAGTVKRHNFKGGPKTMVNLTALVPRALWEPPQRQDVFLRARKWRVIWAANESPRKI
jgi:hypothetical protein